MSRPDSDIEDNLYNNKESDQNARSALRYIDELTHTLEEMLGDRPDSAVGALRFSLKDMSNYLEVSENGTKQTLSWLKENIDGIEKKSTYRVEEDSIEYLKEEIEEIETWETVEEEIKYIEKILEQENELILAQINDRLDKKTKSDINKGITQTRLEKSDRIERIKRTGEPSKYRIKEDASVAQPG